MPSYAGSISDALPDRKFSGDLDWLNKTRTTFGKDLIKFVKERRKQAELVTSNCWGAFTPAAAGCHGDAREQRREQGKTDQTAGRHRRTSRRGGGWEGSHGRAPSSRIWTGTCLFKT